MKTIIVDIDGTLALKGDRDPFDWQSVGNDQVNTPIKWLVQSFVRSHIKIILFSGRDESCRELTEHWLGGHGIPYDELYMRPAGDHRKDTIVKREMYDKHIAGIHEVVFVLDDRDQVVKMWREELGITCLQVAYGDF